MSDDNVIEYRPPGRRNGQAAPLEDDRFAPIDSVPEDDANAGPAPDGPVVALPARTPLNWATLATKTPPRREWVIDGWLPAGEVTLLSGPGGTGKTGVCQALGSCVALGSDYLDAVPHARKVLMWAAEDDDNELWRRQTAICKWARTDIEEFQDRFILQSYHGSSVELAVPIHNKVVGTAMLTELREQVGDYGVELVVLDNVARLYAGNENDRYQVSAFISLLAWAVKPTGAAVLLLGHPAKAAGSEFSGSTAWEGAVRTRLYLGSKHPDQQDKKGGEDDEEIPQDEGVRYLCKRKANYSTQDWRRIKYIEGVMCPEDHEGRSKPAQLVSADYAKTIVLHAVRKLKEMGEFGTSSRSSPGYLPKLAKQYDLLANVAYSQFQMAMVELRKEGRLVMATVGQYSNRNPKPGLVEAGVTQGMDL